ncbi:MAG: type 4a pilus biogenesis protein PilO [Longimicrobiales bacterium]
MALLPSDPAQQKRLLIGLIPVLLLFGYWYFFHGAKKDEILALEMHLERLEAQNQVAVAQTRESGPDLERRVALYEQYMNRLEQLIPEREEVPDLLHSMTLQAQQTGVDLVFMRPQDEAAETFYNRQTYELAVAGGYHDVGRYLTSIGSLPRIVAPIDLNLIPVPASREDETRVEATFRIYTYVIPNQPPPAVDPAAGGSQ